MLAADPQPLLAPPAWRNSELVRIAGAVVHAGGGRLDGSWHRQDGAECLVVIAGELVVEFEHGSMRAGPGEAVVIEAGEPHRTSVADDCLLLSVEPASMQRLS